jgi:hypothetical protein
LEDEMYPNLNIIYLQGKEYKNKKSTQGVKINKSVDNNEIIVRFLVCMDLQLPVQSVPITNEND